MNELLATAEAADLLQQVSAAGFEDRAGELDAERLASGLPPLVLVGPVDGQQYIGALQAGSPRGQGISGMLEILAARRACCEIEGL